MVSADEILNLCKKEIIDWHKKNENRPKDTNLLTDKITHIRSLGEHRLDIMEVTKDLIVANTELWHLADQVRSDDDETLLRAIRQFSPFNQHRNDLIEEIDEIFKDEENRRVCNE